MVSPAPSAGAKTWALRYRRQSDSAKRTHTLGRYPDMKLEEARGAGEDARRAVAKGADPAGDKRARKAADTFAEVADEWIELHATPNKAALTVERDRRMLKRHVLPEIGSMKAGEVTKRDVIRLLDKVAAKSDARLKPSKKRDAIRKMTHQPNRVFELVRSIFRWALGRDLLKTDPTFGLSPPIKKKKPRERELSPIEIWALWLALDRAPVSRDHLRRQEGDFPMRRATALAMYRCRRSLSG